MFKVTNSKMKEIESLIPEHADALVAFGGDMYRKGIFAGAAYLAMGIGVGSAIHYLNELREHKKTKTE